MLIDPLNMDNVDPGPLAENLERLRRALIGFSRNITERETLAIMNCMLSVVKVARMTETAGQFRGGYRSLYVMVCDGATSTRVTDERRAVYAAAARILEGNES